MELEVEEVEPFYSFGCADFFNKNYLLDYGNINSLILEGHLNMQELNSNVYR